jgi:protoheme ferro-lyase
MKVVCLSLVAGCLMSVSPGLAAQKVGVLFSSYGDIDSPEEAEGFVKSAILDPDIAPIPGFLRGLISTLGWTFKKTAIENEYKAIGGGTHYRAASKAQTDLVQDALKKQRD